MTGTMGTLLDLLPHTILRLRLGRDRQAILASDGGGVVRGIDDELVSDHDDTSGLGRTVRVLGLLDRIARASPATGMTAADADAIDAVGGLATMAGAMDAHANRLVHALDATGHLGGRDPLVGFQRESVLLEQGPSLLLLDGGTTGRDGRIQLGRAGGHGVGLLRPSVLAFGDGVDDGDTVGGRTDRTLGDGGSVAHVSGRSRSRDDDDDDDDDAALTPTESALPPYPSNWMDAWPCRVSRPTWPES